MKKYISAVATQGRDKYFEHVKTFSLAFSQDGFRWDDIMELGEKKVFKGNCDHFTPVVNRLPYGVSARFVRFYPITSMYPCMRVEVYGC
ncbi:predicted protein [Nematostella vectensis]|uniref:F5/8 type C domain-containing protein n=2 Tax=Nematostella vectensis TaxID=45351 RepID=A7RMF9_NEMVE|nr:predicted protein [Nematostella vectensis]|eukprot:XP_001639397.1 predicted protein [Nematostella vectensis]